MPSQDQPEPEHASHEDSKSTAPRQDAESRDEETVEQASTAPEHPVPAPGEPAGDMWPGVYAVRADADEDDDVTGVEDTALAPPGKPDGEADTRP